MTQATAAEQLLNIAGRYQLPGLRDRLTSMTEDLQLDLCAVETLLQNLSSEEDDLAGRSAAHLLAAGGKRLRPILCLLAARSFPATRGPKPAIDTEALRSLAVVAEFAHSATLLHDDVIDLGETRRGRPASRLIFGNAASVLGGDLLLVQGLQLVQQAGIPELLPTILQVLRRMIRAEALQLALRGDPDITVDEHLEIVLGKTASLFEWSLEAGARCAGANEDGVASMVAFGRDLGVAFQLLDDLLDLRGDASMVGKAVLQDVQAGTVTYPVLHALAEQPELRDRLRAAAQGSPDDTLGADVLIAVRRCGGIERAQDEVNTRTRQALSRLSELPESKARDGLAAVAHTLSARIQ